MTDEETKSLKTLKDLRMIEDRINEVEKLILTIPVNPTNFEYVLCLIKIFEGLWDMKFFNLEEGKKLFDG